MRAFDLEAASTRVGSVAQYARVDSFFDANGPGVGTRRIRMVTGGGLELELLPDRALDIGHLTFDGVPLAWISSVGAASPHAYSARGTEWLRTFGGGFLATCGLDTFGPPSSDDGVEFPMHGRVGTIPATVTEASVTGNELRVSAEVRQAKVFSENLVLRRTLTADVGGTQLRINDTVTNEAAFPSGHMILYHFNLGWPLVDQGAVLSVPAHTTTPRDDAAQSGIKTWNKIDPPTLGYREQVFQHEFEQGRIAVSIDNPKLGMQCELSFDSRALPALYQWKMMDHGHYVVGLEPTNVAHVFGRQSAREQGVLPVLEPGECVSYGIDVNMSRSTT